MTPLPPSLIPPPRPVLAVILRAALAAHRCPVRAEDVAVDLVVALVERQPA